MPENDPLDRLIDSALATYADPSPGLALVQRALARVAAEGGHARTHRWLPWAIALPVATGLLILIMLSGSKPVHRAPDRTNHAQISQPPHIATTGTGQLFLAHSAATQHVNTSRQQTPARRAAFVAKTAPLPKLNVFPTPQPLTPEEQALAEFAARASTSERQSLLTAQEQADAPLQIAAIQIQPIPPPTQGEN